MSNHQGWSARSRRWNRWKKAYGAVRVEHLERSGTVSQYPYKGDGQHWHVAADGQRVEDACWNLTAPLGDALMIPRWFSFYPDELTIEVDGEAVR